MSDIKEDIAKVCDSIKEIVIEKNKRYGNSALEPLEIFSSHCEGLSDDIKISGVGILYRLDDKLSRIKNAKQLQKNDVFDLLGYAVLLCVKMGWKDFKLLLD